MSTIAEASAAEARFDPPLTMSPAAAGRIRAIAAADAAVAGLRLAVDGGGCSGFQYDIQPAAGPAEGDIIVERDGARLFIDPVGVELITGAELDWVEELIGAAFKVKNPNARSSCGCGVSFSV